MKNSLMVPLVGDPERSSYATSLIMPATQTKLSTWRLWTCHPFTTPRSTVVQYACPNFRKIRSSRRSISNNRPRSSGMTRNDLVRTPLMSRIPPPSDTDIPEAQLAHRRRIIDVPSIHDERLTQQLLHALEIQLLELVPFRQHQQAVRTLHRLIGILAERHLWQQMRGLLHGLRIVNSDRGPPRAQILDDVDRRSIAHVVRVGLEGQPEHGDRLVLHHPQRPLHLLGNAALLVLVHSPHGLQQVKVIPRLLRDVDERLQVFRKTKAPESRPGVQERPADARIQPHAVRHLLHIAA